MNWKYFKQIREIFEGRSDVQSPGFQMKPHAEDFQEYDRFKNNWPWGDSQRPRQ